MDQDSDDDGLKDGYEVLVTFRTNAKDVNGDGVIDFDGTSWIAVNPLSMSIHYGDDNSAGKFFLGGYIYDSNIVSFVQDDFNYLGYPSNSQIDEFLPISEVYKHKTDNYIVVVISIASSNGNTLDYLYKFVYDSTTPEISIYPKSHENKQFKENIIESDHHLFTKDVNGNKFYSPLRFDGINALDFDSDNDELQDGDEVFVKFRSGTIDADGQQGPFTDYHDSDSWIAIDLDWTDNHFNLEAYEFLLTQASQPPSITQIMLTPEGYPLYTESSSTDIWIYDGEYQKWGIDADHSGLALKNPTILRSFSQNDREIIYNPRTIDTDNDGVINLVDIDSDNDYLKDGLDIEHTAKFDGDDKFVDYDAQIVNVKNYPFDSSYTSLRTFLMYYPWELNYEEGIIDKISFEFYGGDGLVGMSFDDFIIGLFLTQDDDFENGIDPKFYKRGSYVSVYTRESLTIYPKNMDLLEFDLVSPFYYDSSYNLVIFISWTAHSGDTAQLVSLYDDAYFNPYHEKRTLVEDSSSDNGAHFTDDYPLRIKIDFEKDLPWLEPTGEELEQISINFLTDKSISEINENELPKYLTQFLKEQSYADLEVEEVISGTLAYIDPSNPNPFSSSDYFDESLYKNLKYAYTVDVNVNWNKNDKFEYIKLDSILEPNREQTITIQYNVDVSDYTSWGWHYNHTNIGFLYTFYDNIDDVIQPLKAPILFAQPTVLKEPERISFQYVEGLAGKYTPKIFQVEIYVPKEYSPTVSTEDRILELRPVFLLPKRDEARNHFIPAYGTPMYPHVDIDICSISNIITKDPYMILVDPDLDQYDVKNKIQEYIVDELGGYNGLASASSPYHSYSNYEFLIINNPTYNDDGELILQFASPYIQHSEGPKDWDHFESKDAIVLAGPTHYDIKNMLNFVGWNPGWSSELNELHITDSAPEPTDPVDDCSYYIDGAASGEPSDWTSIPILFDDNSDNDEPFALGYNEINILKAASSTSTLYLYIEAGNDLNAALNYVIWIDTDDDLEWDWESRIHSGRDGLGGTSSWDWHKGDSENPYCNSYNYEITVGDSRRKILIVGMKLSDFGMNPWTDINLRVQVVPQIPYAGNSYVISNSIELNYFEFHYLYEINGILITGTKSLQGHYVAPRNKYEETLLLSLNPKSQSSLSVPLNVLKISKNPEKDITIDIYDQGVDVVIKSVEKITKTGSFAAILDNDNILGFTVSQNEAIKSPKLRQIFVNCENNVLILFTTYNAVIAYEDNDNWGVIAYTLSGTTLIVSNMAEVYYYIGLPSEITGIPIGSVGIVFSALIMDIYYVHKAMETSDPDVQELYATTIILSSIDATIVAIAALTGIGLPFAIITFCFYLLGLDLYMKGIIPRPVGLIGLVYYGIYAISGIDPPEKRIDDKSMNLIKNWRNSYIEKEIRTIVFYMGSTESSQIDEFIGMWKSTNLRDEDDIWDYFIAMFPKKDKK
ncbi:MAG: hypothetical protein ACW99Q_08275 [Candidatus Kariarchaeaceae archaeon]